MLHLHQDAVKVNITSERRSYERQGIDKIPTQHLGHYAHQLEQAGIPSERGNINREIEEINRQQEALQREVAQVNKALEKERTRRAIIIAHEQQEQSRKHFITYEDLYKKAEGYKKKALDELAQEAKRKEARMQQEEQKFLNLNRYERKYLRPHPLQRPAGIRRHKHGRPDWATFAKGIEQKRQRALEPTKPIDWKELAKTQEERRITDFYLAC